MEQLIVVDIGTTGTKVAVIESSGSILDWGYTGYGTQSKGNFVEQNPDDWWEAVRKELRCIGPRVDKGKLRGIILSGQMQDLIPLGKKGVLGPAVLYSDTRATAEIGEIESTIGRNRLKSITGTLQDASSLLAKLLWLKKNNRKIYDDIVTVLLGAHDYVAWKMTGSRNADYTTASTTGLLDISRNQWAVELLSAIGLREDWLPSLVRADHLDGQLSAEAAADLGVPEGIPVFHGSGDAGTATVGAGAGEPGPTYCYLGTSGWVAASSLHTMADPETGIYNLRHPDPARFIQAGPMALAGGTLDWALKEISPFSSESDAYALITRVASEAKAGSGGVVFLPHLSGERAPFKDPDERGGFVGISSETTRADLYRAVFEGVTFAMRSIRETMGSVYAAGKPLTLVGGGARSDLWPQIFADVFGCEVLVLENPENVGLMGSLVICGRALRWFTSYELPPNILRIKNRFLPDRALRQRYEELYSIFKELYPRLRDSYSRLALWREKKGSPV